MKKQDIDHGLLQSMGTLVEGVEGGGDTWEILEGARREEDHLGTYSCCVSSRAHWSTERTRFRIVIGRVGTEAVP